MKKSARVPLILLGTLSALGGCSEKQHQADLYQNRYDTREACVSDWGEDAEACKPTQAADLPPGTNYSCQSDWDSNPNACQPHHNGYIPLIAYLGPRYYWNRSSGAPVAVAQSGLTALSQSSLNRMGPAINGANPPVVRGASVFSPGSFSRSASGLSESHSSVSRGGFGSSAEGSGGG